MELKDLKKQIPYKWRVQEFSKFKAEATCVAYIDARDVMDILDEVVGLEGWQSDYKVLDGQIYAGIGICVSDTWVWKWDTGSEGSIEKEKSIASDSFKRAAVKWGIGRFLYDLPIKRVKANAIKTDSVRPFVVDDKGQRVWDITKHINGTPKVAVAVPQAQVEPVVALKPPANLEKQRLAMEKRIKELVDQIEMIPFATEEDYAKAVAEHTGLEFTPEHYLSIGKKLSEIAQQHGTK